MFLDVVEETLPGLLRLQLARALNTLHRRLPLLLWRILRSQVCGEGGRAQYIAHLLPILRLNGIRVSVVGRFCRYRCQLGRVDGRRNRFILSEIGLVLAKVAPSRALIAVVSAVVSTRGNELWVARSVLHEGLTEGHCGEGWVAPALIELRKRTCLVVVCHLK